MVRARATVLLLCLTAATAQAALLGRAPATPGGTDYQAYYDTVLDITWLADANAIASTPFDDLYEIGGLTISTATDGRTTWGSAEAWVASLNTTNYLGVSDWRQPSMDRNGDTVVVECNSVSELACRDNEMGYQEEYNGVQQTFGCEFQPCIGGPFTNVGIDFYWSGTTYAPNPTAAWHFYFLIGGEYSISGKSNTTLYVWPVRPGDIGVVPVPGAAWLFGSALGVLGWLRRKALAQRDNASMEAPTGERVAMTGRGVQP